MYKLFVSVKAKKELKKISKLHQKAIISALEEIRENPLSGKPLTRELTGRFSYKVSVYRIIYTVNKKDNTISVITSGHRVSVYL